MNPKRRRRHRLIVEVTFDSAGESEKRIKEILEGALNRGLYEHGRSSCFQNIAVKSFRKWYRGKLKLRILKHVQDDVLEALDEFESVEGRSDY